MVASFEMKKDNPLNPINHVLYVGYWGGSHRSILGNLDEVAIWESALDASEINALYDGQSP